MNRINAIKMLSFKNWKSDRAILTNDPQLFTDGSIFEDHRGCAIVYENRDVLYRLPTAYTIFCYEAFAVIHALSIIDEANLPKVAILTDFLSTLEALRNSNITNSDIHNLVTSLQSSPTNPTTLGESAKESRYGSLSKETSGAIERDQAVAGRYRPARAQKDESATTGKTIVLSHGISRQLSWYAMIIKFERKSSITIGQKGHYRKKRLSLTEHVICPSDKTGKPSGRYPPTIRSRTKIRSINQSQNLKEKSRTQTQGCQKSVKPTEWENEIGV